MALPITRRLVFATKLAAVALFAGLFIASAQTALVPLFLVTSWCRWAEGALAHRAAAYGLATMLASAFTVLAMCALQGVLLLTTRRRALSVSAALRSVLLCALMLSLPLVGRLPAEASAFAHGAFWLRLSPPAWFAGIEQYLAGHREPHFVQLARIGLLAWLAAAAAAVSSYALLYRRFDHVMLQSGQPAVRATRNRRTAAHTFRSFAMITLRRSVFHQGIVVVVSAIGLGLVVNSFISSSVLRSLTAGGLPPARAIDSVVWAPFALSYVASRGVRAALLIPLEPRANWVFRITERADLRVDQLSAAVQTVRRLGVIAPVAILLPIQLAIAGPAALIASWTALVCGWLHVELLMKDWVRLPFTCSYIPGKRFVPHMIFFGLTMFLGYTTIGAALARRSMASGPGAVIIDAVLILAIAWQRHRRLATWQAVPLEFEDSLPTEVNPLRLSQAD